MSFISRINSQRPGPALKTDWSAMVYADALKLLREPFYFFILTAPIFIGFLMRSVLPWANQAITAIELVDYYPLVMVVLLLTSPLYYGMVLGLLLLDEKDEDVLTAVLVTPVPLSRYLFARMALYSAASFLLIPLAHEIIDVIDVPLLPLILVALAATFNMALFALLLAYLANNQLEGFAFAKGLGFLILLPAASFFFPGWWQLLLAPLPTYWPVAAYFTLASDAGANGFFFFAILVSLVYQPWVIIQLYRRFEQGLR